MTANTLEPGTIQEARAALKEEAAVGRSVQPLGGGCFKDLGGTRRQADTILSTRRLNGIVFYEPEELVVKVEAGITVAELLEELGKHGQEIPWDEPWPGNQTVGGVVAAGLPGPRRLAFGAPRDHVLGISAALPEGLFIRPGGRVVKNVAGYDITRLFVGSRGTLGAIVEVIMRIKPLAEEHWAVLASYPNADSFLSALSALFHAQVTPSFLEARGRNEGFVLAAGCEGLAEQVAVQRGRMLSALGKARITGEFTGQGARALPGDWVREMWESPGAVFRVNVPRRRIRSIIEGSHEAGHAVWVGAGSGRVRVLPGRDLDRDEAGVVLRRLHGRAAMLGGWAVQERGPLSWADAAAALPDRTRALNESIRRVFDPGNCLGAEDA